MGKEREAVKTKTRREEGERDGRYFQTEEGKQTGD